MTDEIRELLELAAKAADLDPTGHTEVGLLLGNVGEMTIWNPRTSGDDLVDLEVKLADMSDLFEVRHFQNMVSVNFIILRDSFKASALEIVSDHPTRKDALAMAVLRCAAEYQRRKG